MLSLFLRECLNPLVPSSYMYSMCCLWETLSQDRAVGGKWSVCSKVLQNEKFLFLRSSPVLVALIRFVAIAFLVFCMCAPKNFKAHPLFTWGPR